MSDATVSLANVKLLINGNLPSNMLSYVAKQAISGDQVMYCMAIRRLSQQNHSRWIRQNQEHVPASRSPVKAPMLQC